MDEFDALIAKISDYDELDQESFEISGRKVLEETISEPLLIEMLGQTLPRARRRT